MSGITLASAQAELDRWLDISAKIGRTGVQSFALGDSSQTIVTTQEVRANIDYWRRAVRDLSAAASGGADDFATSMPGVAVARVR